MPEKRRTIQLPALPKSWNHLSSAELEQVNLLMRRKQQMLRTTDEPLADRDFKLHAFLLLSGLKIVRRAVRDEKGEFYYLLRRRGILHLLERIPMKSWQINQWIDYCLQFLDTPQKRTKSPYSFIRLYGKQFKSPSDLMTDITYQQYSSAQNLLSEYWNTVKLIDTLIERRASRLAITEQMKKIQMYQCQFLSVLFTPSYIEKETMKDGKTIRMNRRVWLYDQSQIKDNEWRFRHVSGRMFPVMLQFFQSVQTYFSFIYPDLFTTAKGSEGKDAVKMEVETINAVMKYQGFKDYSEVYNSESVRILGVLNTMSKDAKQIEEMNRKMKMKK